MKPKCIYPNTRAAATAVQHWIDHNLPLKLTARPWNRFDATNTEWWLIPSTDWPAYRHGKYYFRKPKTARDLSCGFYVEKGLDPSVAVAFPTGKRLVMDDRWAWHRVVAEMASGDFGNAMIDVVERSQIPVRLSINGSFVEDPGSYDPEAPPMNWNHVVFESDGTDLRLITSELEGEQFAGVVECKSVVDLAGALERMPQSAWMWLNLHVGVRLAMAPLDYDPDHVLDAWEAVDLWELCLEPWRPWII